MPIKDIKEKIIKDAIAEKEKLYKEVNMVVKELEDDFEKEIKNLKDNILDRYNQEAEIKEKNILTEAKLEANKKILTEKQSILNKVFDETARRISNLDRTEYLKLIENIIIENIESGDETLFISQKDKEIINQKYLEMINKKILQMGKKGNLSLSNDYIPISGGVVIGKDEIKKNASIEIMLNRIKEDYETKLSNFLFHSNNEG